MHQLDRRQTIADNLRSDKSLAIHDLYPDFYPLKPASFPSPISVMRSMIAPPSTYPPERLEDLRIALSLLEKKSKSFYTASMVFEGRLKLDLLSLYVFLFLRDDSLLTSL